MIRWADEILFARGAWAPCAALVWMAFSIAAWLSYRGAFPHHARWLGTVLRSLGIGILCLCLLEPVRSVVAPKPQANSVAVLLDNSRSMRALYEKFRTADQVEDPSGLGFEQGRLIPSFSGVISDDADWLHQLGMEYRIRKFLFSGQINPVDEFKVWDGSANESNIQEALESIRMRYPLQAPSAIVLITDGRSTNSGMGLQATDAKQGGSIPVFPVVVPPQGDLRRDLWIEDVGVQTSDFETAPVTISATLGHRGFPSERVEIRLEDLQKNVVQTQTIEIGSGTKKPVVRFRFRPTDSGSQGYKVVCRSVRETPELEMTLDNNQRYVAVDRAMGPYRILYLSGRPNWEYKFLHRALTQDAEMQLTALVRIAKKQPKFSFRSKGNEDSNPLFSGFEDVSEEEKEKYNEPVFARLGVVGREELSKGFPKDAQELFAYSMVILDDLEVEFFTVDQLQLLRQFVSQRGGTLLMLGGQESMRGRGFRDSVLGQLLPVYGDPEDPEMIIPEIQQQVDQTIRYQLSREGWLLPYLRVHDNESDETRRLEQMPEFHVWNRTSQVKAGASVLVEGESSDGKKVPLLVLQKFGKGSTGAMMVGDFWRWALMNQEAKESPYYQACRQLVRGLTVDIPRRVQLRCKPDTAQSSKRLIDVQVMDEKYESLDNAVVEVRIVPPNAQEMVFKAKASMDKAGQYETSLLVRDSGLYRVTAHVRGPDGSFIGESQQAFVYEPEALELADCTLDSAALKTIAQSTGGEVLEYTDLDSLMRKIPVDKLRYTERRTEPIWHTPWLLGIAVGCLAVEWWWRRRHGLA